MECLLVCICILTVDSYNAYCSVYPSTEIPNYIDNIFVNSYKVFTRVTPTTEPYSYRNLTISSSTSPTSNLENGITPTWTDHISSTTAVIKKSELTVLNITLTITTTMSISLIILYCVIVIIKRQRQRRALNRIIRRNTINMAVEEGEML